MSPSLRYSLMTESDSISPMGLLAFTLIFTSRPDSLSYHLVTGLPVLGVSTSL